MDAEPLYPSTGVLRYFDDWRLVMEVDRGLADYYFSLIPPWLPKNKPRWLPHVTVVRAEKEVPLHPEFWKKYDGESLEFLYSPIVHQGHIYYWLHVYCVKLEDIRIELGLPARSQFTLPPEGFRKSFHCTIANQK